MPSTSSAPTPLNSSYKAQASRNDDISEWRKRNKEEGFEVIQVQLHDVASLSAEDAIQRLNEIQALDEKANDDSNRHRQNKKPYIRYVSNKDGILKAHGGGWYLYSGFADTNEKPFCYPTIKLRGKKPVYFRVKCAVKNSQVPNFSVQWIHVVEIWYKFPAETADVVTINQGGKIIRVKMQ